MAFCKLSAQYKKDGYTMIENSFFNDFLLSCPAEAIRVYLWGLYISQNDETENSLQRMSDMLKITTTDILDIYTYWQDRGVVSICNIDPIHIIYNPLKTAIGNIKKFKIGKFNDFNIAIQSIFTNRAITQNELVEYYTVLESFHMEQSALFEIAKYAITVKGDSVGHRYITTIAKQWASEKILTKKQVLEKVEGLSIYDETLKAVLYALGSKAKADINDKELLDKWMKNMDYEIETICHIARSIKKMKIKSDILTLDRFLQRYYEMKLYTILEIDNYENEKQALYTTAKQLVKSLGLYYEDVTRIVEIYVLPITKMGYSSEMIITIADYCFKQSIRTLEAFELIVKKLFKLGIIDSISFNQYLQSILKVDDNIKQILSNIGTTRRVNEYDRNYYKTWTENWNMSNELILHASILSAGKSSGIVYMNKILSNWYTAKITTVEQANQSLPHASKFEKNNKPADNFEQKKYTSEELSSLFSNLDEVEV